ncbi:MAG: S24/S26 family peptidase [Oscillospiraceae bacterium]|nr:S24/S26 family peptidase [Oscillospiraceae bacterium]
MSKQVALDDLMPIIQEQLDRGDLVRLIPQGTSMLPMIHPGEDTVILRRADATIRKYDIVLYRRKDGKYVLHRIVRVGETYTALGDNCVMLEKGIQHEQILAVVFRCYHGDKEIPMHGPKYRIYCQARYYSRFLRRIVAGCRVRMRRNG